MGFPALFYYNYLKAFKLTPLIVLHLLQFIRQFTIQIQIMRLVQRHSNELSVFFPGGISNLLGCRCKNPDKRVHLLQLTTHISYLNNQQIFTTNIHLRVCLANANSCLSTLSFPFSLSLFLPHLVYAFIQNFLHISPLALILTVNSQFVQNSCSYVLIVNA